MNPERLAKIKTLAERHLQQAERILEGDAEYDGADGARYMLEMADYCLELIAAYEALTATPSAK